MGAASASLKLSGMRNKNASDVPWPRRNALVQIRLSVDFPLGAILLASRETGRAETARVGLVAPSHTVPGPEALHARPDSTDYAYAFVAKGRVGRLVVEVGATDA